jgi:hypothetical protein
MCASVSVRVGMARGEGERQRALDDVQVENKVKVGINKGCVIVDIILGCRLCSRDNDCIVTNSI